MITDFLKDRFNQNPEKIAFIWNDNYFSFQWLLDSIENYKKEIIGNFDFNGKVISLEGQYSPHSVAMLLALIELNAIIAPITTQIESKLKEYHEISETEFIISMNLDKYEIIKTGNIAKNELITELRNLNNPGLLLFSSGTAGTIKAALHDFSKLFIKYHTPGKDFITLAFMLFDHIGGVDTLFYSISNASTVVNIDNRSPESICKAIEKYKIQVLPTTPTFLNLLIYSEEYKKYDLSSLKYITYGTEPMPESTLKKCLEIFNDVKFLQKYGTTEVGTLRSKSESQESLWVKIGGEGYQTRIIDGLLQIKAESAMMGYLNAPQPFTEDGWFITGDSVEVNGEYYRILGRKSELINVGGEKVYPAEVENSILEIDNISDVTVFGEKNPLMGNIVCAAITLIDKEIDQKEFIKTIKKQLAIKLEPYKIPVKIKIIDEVQYTERFKKGRKAI
jgi:acyl-CoA synthetase (AMP-forming)/AMP-acid ligase II